MYIGTTSGSNRNRLTLSIHIFGAGHLGTI